MTLVDVIDKKIESIPSTFKQNRYIYHYLGLDVRSCNPQLLINDAVELIKQMKVDPKFVYDYLVDHKAKIVDSSKVEKLISKEKVMKVKTKTKTQLCKELYAKNKKLTTKQIASKIGCDIAVAWRAINGKTGHEGRVKSKVEGISGLELHIKKNYTDKNINFSVEDLANSYNTENETKYTINQFNKDLKILVAKNKLSKVDKSLYGNHTSKAKKIVSACADNFILKRINSGRLRFSLSDVSKTYPEVDSKKIKKAVQNWAYSGKSVHGHTIQSNGYGKYIITNKDEVVAINPVNTKEKISSDNTGKALEIAKTLYKMVGLEKAITFIKLIEDLKNG